MGSENMRLVPGVFYSIAGHPSGDLEKAFGREPGAQSIALQEAPVWFRNPCVPTTV